MGVKAQSWQDVNEWIQMVLTPVKQSSFITLWLKSKELYQNWSARTTTTVSSWYDRSTKGWSRLQRAYKITLPNKSTFSMTASSVTRLPVTQSKIVRNRETGEMQPNAPRGMWKAAQKKVRDIFDCSLTIVFGSLVRICISSAPIASPTRLTKTCFQR